MTEKSHRSSNKGNINLFEIKKTQNVTCEAFCYDLCDFFLCKYP